MNNKKVVLLRHKLNQFGGAELVLVKEFQHLKSLGYDVSIATFDFNKKEFEDRIDDSSVHNLDKNSISKQIYKLTSFLKKESPGVVIAHQNAYIHLFLSSFFLTKKPCTFLRMYGISIWLLGSRLNYSYFFRKKLEIIRDKIKGHKEFINLNKKLTFKKRVLTEIHAVLDFLSVRSIDKILTFSKHTAWEIKKLYNKNPLLIPAGVDTSYFNNDFKDLKKLKVSLGYKNDEKIITTVNRLDERKRIDLLIKILSDINIDNLKLIIIGKGPQENNLKKLVKNLELEDKVDFRGFVKDKDLLKFYKISDIILYPAWCAWGLVPLEALSMNKKVVISSDSMVQDVISNLDNVFVRDPTEEEFKAGILKALNASSSNSRKYIKKEFDWKIHFKKLSNIIEKYCK